MRATISAPMPPLLDSFVRDDQPAGFLTESTIGASSSGEMLRGSITSAEIPSFANSSAAASASANMLDRATIVT